MPPAALTEAVPAVDRIASNDAMRAASPVIDDAADAIEVPTAVVVAARAAAV